MLSIEPLDGRRHGRDAFHCGQHSLDRYLHELALQHRRKKISTTWVLIDNQNPSHILGYYTLSASSLALAELSLEDRRRLPRHPVPAVRMGRLAVLESAQGKGYGELLLQNAVKRAMAAQAEIGVYALTVDALDDALDERAAKFYLRYGFRRCTGDGMQLYLPLGAE